MSEREDYADFEPRRPELFSPLRLAIIAVATIASVVSALLGFVVWIAGR